MSTHHNPAKGRVSSPFNPRRKHPVTGVIRPHNGADIANVTGTPVVAAHAGTVRTGYEPNGGGHWVILTSGTVETRYLHLSRRDVKPGQTVKAGARIGLMGSTGNSTGPHLHFEVRVKGVPTDPVPWLAARGVTFGTDTPPAPAPIPTYQEVPEMIFRLKTSPVYSYLLVSGGVGRKISKGTAARAKKVGVPIFTVTAAEFKAWS